MFNAINSKTIISKSKNIFSFFFCISEMYIKFVILWKRRSASEVICFWNYRLQKAELLKCPKCPVSEHLWTGSMLKCLKGPNHCLNLHGSIFDTFFDHSEKKICCKNSVLVVSIIFRLFVNILTPDDKYSLLVKASL